VSKGAVLAMLIVAAAAWADDARALACTVSATSTNFGAYSPFDATALDGTGNVRVACNEVLGLLVSYTIKLSPGASGSLAARRMSNGTHSLTYNLYTGSGRSTVWGDGSNGSSVVSDSYLLFVLSVTRDYAVYGRVPASQNVSGGSYADTIVVTVEY